MGCREHQEPNRGRSSAPGTTRTRTRDQELLPKVILDGRENYVIMSTMIRIQLDTLEALRELRWRYRCRSLSDVVDHLIRDAEPELYQDVISEDLPEHEE